MEFFSQLLVGAGDLWGGGVAHSVFILAIVISVGLMLGKIKVAGVSLGVTWILFTGLVLSHFGMTLNGNLLHFLKEFGLILFVYSIGLQVGPGFFSAFKKGGLQLNALAMIHVGLGALATVILFYVSGLPITTMVGILSGAVTNTPGLGAAQQAASDMRLTDVSDIAMGYAIAYPIGVIGMIGVLIAMRYIFRVNPKAEEEKAQANSGDNSNSAISISLQVRNEALEGKTIDELAELLGRNIVISRIHHVGMDQEMVNAQTVLHLDDELQVTTTVKDASRVIAFIGKTVDAQWDGKSTKLISRRILITKPELNGKKLEQLDLRGSFGISVTRVNRAGVDLVATPGLTLQMGDRVTIVGDEKGIKHTEKLLGNSLRRLDTPNLITIFVGIALGVIIGSIPFAIPGIPQPVKLGLAGGPLVVSILISRFGPKYKLVTYTTMSANLMLREIGISIFLACVGLEAGEGFVRTIVEQQGYIWIGYGAIITIVPLLIAGLIGRYCFKLNYYTLIGVLSGATTNPPALAFSNDSTSCDAPSVGYATVYPLSMFLRVLTAQLLILSLAEGLV